MLMVDLLLREKFHAFLRDAARLLSKPRTAWMPQDGAALNLGTYDVEGELEEKFIELRVEFPSRRLLIVVNAKNASKATYIEPRKWHADFNENRLYISDGRKEITITLDQVKVHFHEVDLKTGDTTMIVIPHGDDWWSA